jgi:hypothetical protein
MMVSMQDRQESANELMLDEEAHKQTEFKQYQSYVDAATQQLRAVVLGEVEVVKVTDTQISLNAYHQ